MNLLHRPLGKTCPAVETLAFALLITFSTLLRAEPSADIVYHHAFVFTVDSQHPKAEALAIRDGRIIFVGRSVDALRFVGAHTKSIDLHGRFVMPGLIDGHMHPLDAGQTLLKPSLEYESLTEPEFRQRIQQLLDRTSVQEPDTWLEVCNWFQENMRPAGIRLGRESLDQLRTRRPIIVRSSFGHTVLVNSRALAFAGISAKTPDPVAGKVWRGPSGEPTGLLEDAASDVFETLLPAPSRESNIEAARAALRVMARQGVTSFLDARAEPEAMEAFSALRNAGQLTARAHFALPIQPAESVDPAKAVARIESMRRRFDEGPIRRQPGIRVRTAKLFLDGIISVPAFTGAVLEAYRTNCGTADHPRWVAGGNRGARVYFEPAALAAIMIRLGQAGIDTHMHADGDAAVHTALDGCRELRAALPGADLRPAIAHAEIVQPADFARFREQGVIPVLSFQWARPTDDQVVLATHLGPARARLLEPAGKFVSAGVHPAFGSDWPVDRLDEWFAFQIAVTRRNPPSDAINPARNRLGADPGLSREEVLKSATCGSARELRLDELTGALAVGKLADLIVLDRNPLRVPETQISKVQVLQTLVGGEVVYEQGRNLEKH